jgi:hypothetical protein
MVNWVVDTHIEVSTSTNVLDGRLSAFSAEQLTIPENNEGAAPLKSLTYPALCFAILLHEDPGQFTYVTMNKVKCVAATPIPADSIDKTFVSQYLGMECLLKQKIA